MSDIFKLIRANIERPRRKAELEENEENSFDFRPSTERKGVDLDDFIIGDEEKKYQNRPKKQIPELDFLDEEIGAEKDKKDKNKYDLKKLDFVALDKMKPKEQIFTLKTEYLDLLDKFMELNGETSKVEKSLGDLSIKSHQLKKENFLLMEFVRAIADILPDGTDIKRKLQTSSWSITEVENELVEKFKQTIDRAKNIDVYVEKETEEIRKMNKALERKITQMKAETLKLEQQLEDSNNMVIELKHQNIQLKQSQVENHSTVTKEPIHNEKINEHSSNPVKEVEFENPKKEEQKTSDNNDKQDFGGFQFQFSPPPRNTANTSEATSIPEVKKEPLAPVEVTRQEEPKKEDTDLYKEIYSELYNEELNQTEEEEEDDGGMVLLEVDRYLDSLPDTSKFLIKVIGETGISRNSELKSYLDEAGNHEGHFLKAGKFSYPDMSQSIKNLRDGGFLESEKVKLGARGGHNYQVYELTDLGKSIYKAITNKKPATPEMRLIVKQHKTLEHGYLIKDCALLFEQMGYKVLTNREDLRFDLPGGKRKDFDLIIEKDNQKCHIEVERGTHTDEDFFDAMDKVLDVFRNVYGDNPKPFYFIAPNEEKLYGKTKVQFYKWINERLEGMEKAKEYKIVVNFSTFEKVKKGGKIWDTVELY